MDLVLGAGGFVGRRLVAALAAAGRRVRGLVRTEAAEGEVARLGGEPVRGDLLRDDTLGRAFDGAESVYYLIHSLKSGPGYDWRDALAIGRATSEARRAGARRLLYVGGLGAHAESDSLHLRSRFGVEVEIRGAGVPFTIFRAGAVLGRGGASFEVMRDVVRGMPIVPILDWRRTHSQPISADDLIRYLVSAPSLPAAAGRTFDVGCPERVTYDDMLMAIAARLELPLRRVRVPGYWPRASALALRAVTRVEPEVVRALIPGLREEMVCHDRAADDVFGFLPRSVQDAVDRAIREYETEEPRS